MGVPQHTGQTPTQRMSAPDVSGALAEGPSSKLTQPSPFPNGGLRKHIYGRDVDLAQAWFGSWHGPRLPAAPTPGETRPCRLTRPRREGGSQARSEACDSRGADTRRGG